ncbi:MAG: hypothetical protein ABSA57_22425 [Candidatus Acidiferrales bacterium]
MILTPPYPAELLRVARKVVWYDSPDDTLADLPTFLTHLMVYGSSTDMKVVERYVPLEEFRRVLENPPTGVFTKEVWMRWHERFGMPVPPLPRRRFPDGSVGPEAGEFCGR